MNVLVLKLNATGDVVRTTTVLDGLGGKATWITARGNLPLIEGIADDLRCLAWEDRAASLDQAYDLAINLEDDVACAEHVRAAAPCRTFGARLGADGSLAYSEDASAWFDMSLISRFGRKEADALKLRNRRTYQELLFEGLGRRFEGEPYRLPAARRTDLVGDVAIAPVAGPVWPMKAWAHYDSLRRALEAYGLVVNELPRRPTLLEHLGDIAGHRCLVSGDSLPMHLALGLGVRCVTLFNCTSPWEIHDYGLQEKVVSPLLANYFYRRDFDERAIRAIPLEEVLDAVLRQLGAR